MPASPLREEGVASDGERVPEGHQSLHNALYGHGGAVAEHGDASAGVATAKEVFERQVARMFGAEAAPLSLADAVDGIEAVRANASVSVCGIYGLYMASTTTTTAAADNDEYALAFVGFSRNLLPSIKAHQEAFAAFARSNGYDEASNGLYVRLRVWDAKSKGMPTREKFMAEKRAWLAARGDAPPNEIFQAYWMHFSGDEDSGEISMRRARELGTMSDDERSMYEDKKAKLQKAMGENSHANETHEEKEKRLREKMMRKAVDESDWSAVINEQTAETVGGVDSSPPAATAGGDSDADEHAGGGAAVASPFASKVSEAVQGHTDTTSCAQMTPESVHEALEAVRPYLIADGGDVEVVSIKNEDGVVVLRLQGACGNCPSSSTTMKMGIERVLKERFGDALKEVLQADESGALVNQDAVTVALVDAHLDTLRPAIVNYGGEVHVLELSATSVTISYTGPPPILVGIKAAIKDKFPSIETVEVRDGDGQPC